MPDFSVELAGHQIDPLSLQQLAEGNDNEPADLDAVGAWLVQLRVVPTAGQRQELQRRYGLQLDQYVPELAYVERLTFRIARSVQQDPLVRAVTELEPRFKVSPLLADFGKDDNASALLVDVSVFDDTDLSAVVQRLADRGIVTRAVLDDRPLGGRASIRVAMRDSEEARWVSRLPGVRWLEPFPEIVDDAAVDAGPAAGTAALSGGHTCVSYAWEHGLNGEGQVVGILDNGLPDLGHCFFGDPDPGQPVGTGHRKVEAIRDASGTPLGAHASFTAGCLAGDSWKHPGTEPWRGSAWAARLVAGNRRDLAVHSVLHELVTAAGHGAHVHSNSWHSKPQGSGGLSIYDDQAADVDRFMFEDEEQLVVGSSGNNTEEQGSPGNAKNALCVAGAQKDVPVIGDGAPGPSGDGRRKPDLMAVGCGIDSAIVATTCDVGPKEPCASSYATPVAAGAAALVRQYVATGRAPYECWAETAPELPTGALLKAVLVAAAVVPGALPVDPSDRRGWGSLDLRRVLDFGEGTRRLLLHDVRHARGLSTGGQWYRELKVAPHHPLVVVLAWSDPPGSAGADPVVNNLDLVVTSPQGVDYLGNVVMGGRSVPGGQPDRRNNVEVVVVESPVPGTWQARVGADRVSTGKPGQGYALVVTGAATWLHPCSAGAELSVKVETARMTRRVDDPSLYAEA